METLLKPEIYIPIILNIVLTITTIALAVTTYFYLMETRSLRKGMLHQLEITRRQHFVTTAPFLYAATMAADKETKNLRLEILNPSEKLARDIKYIVFESNKKTFRFPDKSFVVTKPSDKNTVSIADVPSTKSEVETKIKSFYGITNLNDDLVTEGDKSYILLLYTDVEGSVYSVKANFTLNDDNAFSRSRSRFKKVYDPRD